MMEYRAATAEDIEVLMEIRLEMLREVNGLSEDHEFSTVLVEKSREYFLSGDQTTILAFEGSYLAGCGSISYIEVMPTYDHPTGRRGHIMNVYTRPEFRRCGAGRRLMEMLTEDAKAQGATEISLDATEQGRPLYRAMGFVESGEAMVMVL